MHLTCIRAAERAHAVFVRPGGNEGEPLQPSAAVFYGGKENTPSRSGLSGTWPSLDRPVSSSSSMMEVTWVAALSRCASTTSRRLPTTRSAQQQALYSTPA